MDLAGRRPVALAAFALVLLALLVWLQAETSRHRAAPKAAAAERSSRGRIQSNGLDRPKASRRKFPVAEAARDEDASTVAQMACNRAVEDLLTRRLKSSDVLEAPRMAAGVVIVEEQLRMTQAMSKGTSLSTADLSSLERSIRQSPEDPLLARLHATRCRAPRCDPQRAFAHLVALEPDNLATWMLAPHDDRRPTQAEDDAWLAQAGRATYFDAHHSEYASAVLEVAGPVPAIPECDGPLRAMASNPSRVPQTADAIVPVAFVAANLQLPAHLRLSRACPRRELPPRRQADCQKVHVLLAGSNQAMYATGSLLWLAANATPQAERARWSARWRQLQWAMHAGASRALSFENMPLILEQGEIPVLIGYLEEHGQWPPPSDWQPPQLERP